MDRSKIFNLIIAGVGGQGNILVSKIIASAAIKAEFEVRVGETYGAAQRGGSVTSHVRIGKLVKSPQISQGEADVLLGLEPAEARRRVNHLKEGGLAIINTARVYPIEVVTGLVEYPSLDSLLKPIEAIADKVVTFDALELARRAGNPITMNVVMCGALAASNVLPFLEKFLKEELRNTIPERMLDVNEMAYEAGKHACQKNS